MKKTILPVKPISQLFPIPMVMGCEGVSAAMLLQFNHHSIKATEIMSKWPKHPNNPYKRLRRPPTVSEVRLPPNHLSCCIRSFPQAI